MRRGAGRRQQSIQKVDVLGKLSKSMTGKLQRKLQDVLQVLLSYGDVLLHIAAHGFLMVLSYRICTVLCMRSLSGYCTCCLQCCVTTGGKIFSPHNTRKGKCTLFSAENVKVWLWCSMQSSSQLSSETHSFISTHTLYTLRINEKFEVSPIFFQIISNFVFMRELFCWRWTSETLQGLCQNDKE